MFKFDWTDSGNSSDHQEQVLRLNPGDDAVLQWNIAGESRFVLVEKNDIVSDDLLLQCLWGKLPDIYRPYKNRTNGVSCTANELAFTLLDISIQDAGRYIAITHDGAGSPNMILFIYGEYICIIGRLSDELPVNIMYLAQANGDDAYLHITLLVYGICIFIKPY